IPARLVQRPLYRRLRREGRTLEFPDDLRYTKDHERLRLQSNDGVVGITDFAQESLGDVVFVELPTGGAALTRGQTFGVVESTNTVADVLAPVGGRVLSVNQERRDEPERVNQDPYGDGWMIRVSLTRPDEVDALLDADAYRAFVASDQQK